MEDVVKIKNNPMRGALIDQYNQQALIIKLKSPSDVIKNAIDKFDKNRMTESDLKSILSVLGNIEFHYQKQFKDVLAYQSELIASPYPVQAESGNGQLIDVSQFKGRNKRQIWRAFLSLLRFARPAARVAGKLTKYGKFMKAVKYTGYAASTAVFAYEMATIFGAVPDQKYNELSAQLLAMHENRFNDLQVMRNISLLTVNNQKSIIDFSQEFDRAIGNSRDRVEMSILISQVFSSYLQQLTTGLLLFMQGKIPSFFISLETQIKWLETKLPGILINEISSITPHLTVSLKGIDSDKNQLILMIDVPKVTSSFQILNFVEWEPEVISKGKCYTSPKKFLYLAFPPTSNSQVIKNPLLIDPDSCQTSGYIMCESDSIIDRIPGLAENRLCNKLKTNRNKRDIDNMFEMASTPTYDVTRILESTLETRKLREQTKDQFQDLQERMLIARFRISY